MTKLQIARMIAWLSIIIGCTVMIGWLLDITILTSIFPQWIRMKFATAVCFVFSGIIVYALSWREARGKEFRQIILTIFPMLLVLTMGTLFLGSIFDFQTGMENFAFVDIHELKTPIFQGRPSVATMISFLLIAIAGFFSNFKRSTQKIFTITGLIVGGVGVIGGFGYILNLPALYYEIPGFSNAIAANTTCIFALLGLALLFISEEQEH